MSWYQRVVNSGNLPTIQEQGVWVNGQTGSDTTGTGSAINPFATLTHAYSTILDAATGKRYTIFLIGTVTESVAVKPWTEICGFGPLNSLIVGTLTYDSSWDGVDGTFSLMNLFVTEITFDNSAFTSTTPSLFFSGIKVGTLSSDDITLNGGANEGSLEIWDSDIAGGLLMDDYSLSWYNTSALTIEYDRPNGAGIDTSFMFGGRISSGSPDPIIANTGAGALVFEIRNLWTTDIDVTGNGAASSVILTYDAASYPTSGTFTPSAGAVVRSAPTTPNNIAFTSVTDATYTALLQDCVLLCNRAGAIAITLPDPSSQFVIEIKDISGNAAVNNITITPAAGNIDGAASYTINTNYGAVRLFGDGSNYWVLYG